MIHFITGNQNKVTEARNILGNIQIEQLNIDLPEIQSLDPHKVIEAKLREAHKRHQGELMVEDTSLYLDAMAGKLPGPFIKWFLEALGAEGIADIATKFGVHGATATNLFGYMDNQGNIKYFEGSIRGNVVYTRGDNGFGWDAIFQPEGYIKTFAELSQGEKNKISHRKIALDKLRGYLAKKS